VDTVRADLSRLFGVHNLLDLGGVSGRSLLGARHRIFVAVLLAGDLREFAALAARAKAVVDSKLVAVLARVFDSVGARRI